MAPKKLKEKDKKKINWASIRSWIQTFAAIIAIFAAIAAFYKAFETDTYLQDQINSLKSIVEESKIHTALLEAQRDTLTKRWRAQISPVFEIECDFHSGGTSEIVAFLVNSGKIATDIKVFQNTDFDIDIPFKNLGEGMKEKIFLSFKNREIDKPEIVDLDVTLSFKDVSGTIGYQRILIKEFIKSIEKRMRTYN